MPAAAPRCGVVWPGTVANPRARWFAARPPSRGQWDKGRIVGLGWTDAEQLVVVIDDGTFRLYNLHGEMKQFSLGRVRR